MVTATLGTVLLVSAFRTKMVRFEDLASSCLLGKLALTTSTFKSPRARSCPDALPRRRTQAPMRKQTQVPGGSSRPAKPIEHSTEHGAHSPVGAGGQPQDPVGLPGQGARSEHESGQMGSEWFVQ